jgi:hypothetical protein
MIIGLMAGPAWCDRGGWNLNFRTAQIARVAAPSLSVDIRFPDGRRVQIQRERSTAPWHSAHPQL